MPLRWLKLAKGDERKHSVLGSQGFWGVFSPEWCSSVLSAGCNAETLILAKQVSDFLQLEQKVQISFRWKVRPKTETQRELHEQFQTELRTARLLDEEVRRNVKPRTAVMRMQLLRKAAAEASFTTEY